MDNPLVFASITGILWMVGCLVAMIANSERREDYYGVTAPARGRDIVYVMLSWLYIAGLLALGCWSVAKATAVAIRRGW